MEFLKENGIDIDKSLELLGDIETYNEILNDFYSELDDKLENLTNYKDEYALHRADGSRTKISGTAFLRDSKNKPRNAVNRAWQKDPYGSHTYITSPSGHAYEMDYVSSVLGKKKSKKH